MLLVDTSVWIDHLRKGDIQLVDALNANTVLCHSYIIGEIALGSFKNRVKLLSFLDNLPQAPLATNDEVRLLIERRNLYGRGIGYVDCTLIASALIASEVKIWTRDKRLQAIIEELNLSVPLS